MVNSRAKGASGERELAKYLRDNYGTGTRRGQQYSGANGDADVVGLDGIYIEVKRVEKLNILPALKKAISDAIGTGRLPVVFWRKNREAWAVTQPLDDWMEMYEAYRDANLVDKHCANCGHYKPTDELQYEQELRRMCEVNGGWRNPDFSCSDWIPEEQEEER